MSIKAVDAVSDTTCGILKTVDHVLDSGQILAIIGKSALSQERRDQLVEGFARALVQDKGKEYTPTQTAILKRHDSGEIV